MKANTAAFRAVVAGAAAFYALLPGLAPHADAGIRLRSARDISGMWIEFPFSLDFDASLKRGEPQKVVLQPEYEARYKALLAERSHGEAAGKPKVDPLSLCLPAGMPETMRGFFPMEIVTTKKVVYVIPEGVDPLRRIYLDGRPIPSADDLNPTFEGFSVGKWEGSTLVVETAGLKATTRIAGVPHSEGLRIQERIRLLDDDTLEDELTITDPKAFRAKWVVTKHYKDYNTGMDGIPPDPGTHPEHRGAELEPGEFVCNENNRNLPSADGVVGAQLGGR